MEKEYDLYKKQPNMNIFDDISAAISCVPASAIEDIVNTSNEKRILYHGIYHGVYPYPNIYPHVKKSHVLGKIKKEGIKPLTPESGPCSFWSTGIALFHPPSDSPFFRYSGGYSPYLNGSEFNLAITSYDLLFKECLNLSRYKKDSQIKIKDIVPYKALIILNVKVKHPLKDPVKDYKILRKYRQVAERMLLEAITSQMHHEFSPGKIIKQFKEIKEPMK